MTNPARPNWATTGEFACSAVGVPQGQSPKIQARKGRCRRLWLILSHWKLGVRFQETEKPVLKPRFSKKMRMAKALAARPEKARGKLPKSAPLDRFSRPVSIP